ncbi:hypothetical protein ACLOJK_025221 [Asimina triloba]
MNGRTGSFILPTISPAEYRGTFLDPSLAIGQPKCLCLPVGKSASYEQQNSVRSSLVTLQFQMPANLPHLPKIHSTNQAIFLPQRFISNKSGLVSPVQFPPIRFLIFNPLRSGSGGSRSAGPTAWIARTCARSANGRISAPPSRAYLNGNLQRPALPPFPLPLSAILEIPFGKAFAEVRNKRGKERLRRSRRRGKMFRLHRYRSERSGEKVPFKFFDFNVIQVPKGWDKLIVSIVSMETGRSVIKSSKATVRSGACQWADSLSESLWIAHDESTKELEESLFKFVISVGSSRSGILGEAVVNLADYVTSKVPVPACLPLKKCNGGTILQVKIHCLSPRIRDKGQGKEATAQLEDMNVEHDDMDNKSDGSDNVFNRSSGSSSSNQFGGGSRPGEAGSREMSLSLSGSHRSSDSGEGSIGLSASSPQNGISVGDTHNSTRRQDSAVSQNSAYDGNYMHDDPARSNPSSFNSRHELASQSPSHGLSQLSVKPANSSKDLVEAAEETVEELRSEVKMWERNARKLKIDLDTLKKGFSDQSRRLADLEMELSAASNERDGFKLELVQLKLSLDESVIKQSPDSAKSHDKNFSCIQKELEDEIKFQKDSNAELSLQLTKTQESNLELVSILQELEQTVEKMKLEIEKLSAQREENDKQVSDLQDTTGTSNEQMGRKDNLALEETVGKQRLEIKFQMDSNADLSHQLAKSQESNIELVSILQELEETIEKQKLEIEELSAQREDNDEQVGDLQDTVGTSNEQMWRKDNLALEETIEKQRLEIKFQMDSNADLSLQLTKSQESNIEFVSILQELEETVEKQKMEIGKLSAKREENDEQVGDLQDTAGTSNEQMWRKDNLALEDLVAELEESQREMKSVVQSLEKSLEEKNREIELQKQLKEQSLKDIQEEWACKLSAKEGEILKLESELSNLLGTYSINGGDPDMMNEIVALRAKVQELEKDCNELTDENLELILKLNAVKVTDNEIPELQNQPSAASTAPEHLQSFNSLETSENFYEMHKQLQVALATVKNSWSNTESHEGREYPDSPEFSPSSSGGRSNSKEQQATMLNDLLELNNLLRVKILEHKAFEEKVMVQEGQTVYAQKQLKDLEVNRAMIAELEAVLLAKDEEIKFLSLSRVELEEKVSNLLEEKNQLGENLEIAQRESSIAAKCLDDARQDFTNSMGEQVSAIKILERKSIELESSKHELEILVSEMEEENVQLSERLSGLEAQLRHLTDERESTRLELERSRRLITDLKNEIEKLGIEMEMQKTDLKQKLQEAQEKCSEAEEESEISKRSYLKLQATVESLIEECNSLQKLNEELRRKRLKSHEYCTHLEAELRASRDRFSESCQKIEVLEENYSSIQKDVVSKENLLTSELETLLQEHKKNEEKLILAESLLKQNNLEKAAEVENLQIEVAHLTAQIMATQDERERMASEAVLEVSTLRADKNKLENSLQECNAKAKQYEDELCALRLESESKLQGLTGIISAAEQNEELFMAERNRMKRSLEETKSSEERLKKTLGETDVKLKALEYEKQLSIDEIASLKDQLQDRVRLQGEISALKALLDETKYEKGKLETSLEALSADFEEAKAERFSFMETISYMQKALSEAEESVRNKVALEEKLLRLEGDLNAKEASCANDAELKNELSRIKRTNSQLQRKIHGLEEERDGYSKRVQALEEEFELKRENRHIEDLQDRSESREDKTSQEASESTQGKHELEEHDEKQLVADLELKIQLLETEALEANKKDTTQLNGYADMDQKASGKNIIKSAEEYEKMEKKVEALEAELKDMQDRYLHMSLNFAEVEAEREELVMKLKTSSVKTERSQSWVLKIIAPEVFSSGMAVWALISQAQVEIT